MRDRQKQHHEWWVANLERNRAVNRAYYAAHRGERHTYYETHREERREYNRRYREAHLEKERAYKAAHRDMRRALKYGITVEELKVLGDKCAICGENHGSKLQVDHDHTTGKVRGMLCRACNLGVGYLRDDPDFLARAINYLTGARP